MQKEFTDGLYELFVRQNLSLTQSIMIMSRKPRSDAVKLAASSIYCALENGSLFSNALKACIPIRFDSVYISFILLAEKNGDLKSTVSYLRKKLEREFDDKKKLIGASVYPVFVILMSIAACVFIGVYTQTSDFRLLAEYIGLLFAVCVSIYVLIFKMLRGSRLSEAFMAVDFLIKSGIELSEAIGCAVQVAGPSSNIGKLFENAKKRLRYGMDLRNAFCCQNYNSDDDSANPERNFLYTRKNRLSEIFYYADTGGSRQDLFERIAANLDSDNEKRRMLCMSLIEPVFIAVAGGFILMLLMTFFMPIINNIGLR